MRIFTANSQNIAFKMGTAFHRLIKIFFLRRIFTALLPVCILLFSNIGFAANNERTWDEEREIILKDFYAGKAEFTNKNFKKSRNALARFITLHPLEHEVQESIFMIAQSSRFLKDWNEAIRYYGVMKDRYPYSKERRSIDYYLGVCYFHIKNTARAIYHLQEYLGKGGPLKYKYHAHIYLGEIYETNRRWQDAVNEYTFVINKADANAKIPKKTMQILHERTAYLYAERLKNKAQALVHFQKAIKLGARKTSRLRLALRSIVLDYFDKGKNFSDLSIADIKIDGDDIWIATFNGGLYRYSRSFQKLKRIPLPTLQTRAVFIDFENVYIATFDGIFLYNKKSSEVFELKTNNSIFRLAQKIIKDDRYLYISTLTKGVLQYDIVKKTMEILNASSYLKTNRIYAMDSDHRYLVFGTIDHGAILMRKKDKKIFRISRQNSLLHNNNVKAVKLDGRFLWLGIHNKGIYRYDLENQQIKFMNWNILFPSTIARREREIWVGTTGNGIRKYDREKQEITKIDAIDGLRSNDIQHIEIEGDYIWIGYLGSGIDILYNPLEP